MIDLNRLSFTGVVGHVEQSQLPNGRPVTKVAVYMSDDYKNQEGEWVRRSARISVSFYGPRAEAIFKLLQKGDQVWGVAKVVTSTKERDGGVEYSTYFDGEDIGKMANSPNRQNNGEQQEVRVSNVVKGATRPNNGQKQPVQQSRPKSTWSQNKSGGSDELDDLNLFDE